MREASAFLRLSFFLACLSLEVCHIVPVFTQERFFVVILSRGGDIIAKIPDQAQQFRHDLLIICHTCTVYIVKGLVQPDEACFKICDFDDFRYRFSTA